MQIQNVIYNAARGSFQGRVDMVSNGRRLRFPCEVAGPITMETGRVQQALLDDARQKARCGTSLLMRRR